MLTTRPADEDDRGLSLIELIVAMGLAMVVMALTMNFFVGALTQSNAATTDSLNTAQARVALDSWSALIRVADSPSAPGTATGRFESITPTDAVFYTDLDNRSGGSARTAPVKVWLSMANGQLTERRYPADSATASTPTYSTYPGSPATTRLLAGCASTVAVSACATPGTVSAAGGFTAYYPPTGCATGNLSAAGLCVIDSSSSPSLDHVVAVGVAFTMTSPDKRLTKGFTTLASVTMGTS